MAYFKMNTWSDKLKYQTELNVYIPDSIDPLKKCDVFICLHGLCGNQTDFEKYHIEQYAERDKFILVFPNGHNSYYLNTKTGEDFLDYTGEEILNIIRTTFKVSINKKGIIGISMGGYGATLVGLRYNFDYIANLSGSVIIQNRVQNTTDNRFYNIFDTVSKDIQLPYLLKHYQPQKLFTYCGRNDFLWLDNQEFNDVVQQYCNDYKIVIDDGNHSFECWFKQFETIFNYFKGEV